MWTENAYPQVIAGCIRNRPADATRAYGEIVPDPRDEAVAATKCTHRR